MNSTPSEPKNQPEELSRRDWVRKGAKAAYIAPVVLAAVAATERPAYGQSSGVSTAPR